MGILNKQENKEFKGWFTCYIYLLHIFVQFLESDIQSLKGKFISSALSIVLKKSTAWQETYHYSI